MTLNELQQIIKECVNIYLKEEEQMTPSYDDDVNVDPKVKSAMVQKANADRRVAATTSTVLTKKISDTSKLVSMSPLEKKKELRNRIDGLKLKLKASKNNAVAANLVKQSNKK